MSLVVETAFPSYYIEFCKRYRAVALITEENIYSLYKDFFPKEKNSFFFLVPEGEKAKSREQKEKIEDFLFSHNFDRECCVVGVGGGVVLDLVGFVSATYKRGIDYISVPTSFLAMVDAAHGGKTGINTFYGKNTLGAIYFPKTIVIDYAFLQTLPLAQKKEGFAEVVKKALVADKNFFFQLEKYYPLWENNDFSFLQFLVKKSIEIKTQIVQRDFLDKNQRAILNFGHTFAHAMERATEYTVSHGKAVALGLVAEGYLSVKLGGLKEECLQRVLQLLLRYDLLFSVEVVVENFLSSLSFDKKNRGKKIFSILLQDIGIPLCLDGKYVHSIPISYWEEAFYYSLQRLQNIC